MPNPDKDPPTLYCFSPHGVFGMGCCQVYYRSMYELKHVTFCMSTVLYYLPFFTPLAKMIGNCGPANKAFVTNALKQKKSLGIVIGGFQEATITSTESDRIYIKHRKGFIKYALQYGYRIVPCFTFGDFRCYWNAQGQWPFRLWLNSIGIPAVLFWGCWWCPLLPKQPPNGIHVVFGKPIPAREPIANPSQEEIDKMHAEYIEAIVGLYERHKRDMQEGSVSLDVW
eukprot:GHVR01146392.1.p1 GENE.GHVR01146392.1~~GHVR01146392.1.p1  ORF type:complete len:226 (+),score=-0.08 GHVR01146392.1:382-1059(+)